MKAADKENIIFVWIIWYFSEMPENLIKAWKNFLRFNLYYFSIPLLASTIFAPWRKYTWEYPRGFDLKIYTETFISNITSRFLGSLVRITLIITGLITEVFIFFAGAILLLLWMLSPVVLIGLVIFAVSII